ncbi:MAG: hypothetical protein VW576_09180 [Opitutae bacterium]
MSNRDVIEQLFEFRIQFRHFGSEFINDRHFTAKNSDLALEMFRFACKKDDLEVEVDSIEQWNRWANRWENTEAPTHEPSESLP